jgi:two-component system, NarL family, invasion response regulator UvrY
VLEAADRVAAFALVETTAVDVLLLDLAMPKKKNGLELLPELRARYPATQVVVLSGYLESHHADETKRRGAAVYLHKECEPLAIRACRPVLRLMHRPDTSPDGLQLPADQQDKRTEVPLESHEWST